MDQDLQEKFVIRMLINGIGSELIADERNISVEQVERIRENNLQYIMREIRKRGEDEYIGKSKERYKKAVNNSSDTKDEIDRVINKSIDRKAEREKRKAIIEKRIDIERKQIIKRLIDAGYAGKSINYAEFSYLYSALGKNMSEIGFANDVLGVSRHYYYKCKNDGANIIVLLGYRRKIQQDEEKIQDKNDTPVPTKLKEKINIVFKKELKYDLDSDRFLESNMQYDALYRIRQDIVTGKGYDPDKFKKIVRAMKAKNTIKKNRVDVEAVVEIFLQLNKFEEAKAFARSIYDDETYNMFLVNIIKEIERKEVRYKVMKYHQKGMSYGEIASTLRILTGNVIDIVNYEQEIDKKIIELNKKGFKRETIVSVLNLNINRVNDVLNRSITEDEKISER